MTEEVKIPSVQVPAATILSIPIGAICGLVFLLPILFTLPDIATLLAGRAFSHITLSIAKSSKNPVASPLV